MPSNIEFPEPRRLPSKKIFNALYCSEEYITRYPNSMPKKNDEQSALSKILHETATNVIDVSALDSHDLEQHEYYERMKAYKARLSGLLRWSPPNQNKLLLTDVPAPEKLLSSDPISMDNFLLVSLNLKQTVLVLTLFFKMFNIM